MIKEYLKKGKENAISRAQLCEITGLSDREVRGAIFEEREAGVLILSDSGARGYWLPGSVEELEAYAKQMEKRAKKIFIASRAARKELAKMREKASEENR